MYVCMYVCMYAIMYIMYKKEEMDTYTGTVDKVVF